MSYISHRFFRVLLTLVVIVGLASEASAQRRGKRSGKTTAAPAPAPEAAPAEEAAEPAPVAASSGTEKAKTKEPTTYDFEDDLVEGDLVRPDGELLSVRRNGRRSSLIRIREHFVPEMLKSVEDL